MNALADHPKIERQPPSAAARREADMFTLRDAIREHGELLESFAISMQQSAWRGHNVETAIHVKNAWRVMNAARAAVKELEALAANIPESGAP